MRALRLSAPLLLLAPLLLALSGCNADPEEQAVQCPKPYLLPDAARLARYDSRGTDISDLLLSVRITDVQGACSGKLGVRAEGAHVHAVMVATRGPAATSAEADIPYGVGVTRSGGIIDEKFYTQHITFPPNVTTLQVTGQEIHMTLPTSKDITGPSYHLYFFLKLSPEELQANRRNPAG